MNTPAQVPPPPPPAASAPVKKQGKGCLFYGCLGMSILLLVIGVTIAGTVWWVKRHLDAPPIEVVELSLEEKNNLDAKLGQLEEVESDGMEEDFARKPMIITEREINGFLSGGVDAESLVQVRLTKDRISVRANIPIPEDFPFFAGRNCRISLRSRLVKQAQGIELRVTGISVGGIPLSKSFIRDLTDQNLLEGLQTEEGVPLLKLLDNVERLEVQSGKIVILLAE